MARGDISDMAARIRAVLPTSWFPTTATGQPTVSPVLDGVLAGLGAGWAKIWNLLAYTRLQTRILTATDFFLDLISADFFGTTLPRKANESDDDFRARIEANLFAPKATRAAIIRAMQRLTGQTPVVFEPAYTHDTGGYGSRADPAAGGGWGYGRGPAQQWAVNEPGGYGSLKLPFQFFITVYRPVANGLATIGGYGSRGSPAIGGGYGYGSRAAPGAGGGLFVYGSLALAGAQVADADIYAALLATMPAATIAWVRIANGTALLPLSDETGDALLDESGDPLILG